jgi:transketolase
MKDIDKLDEKCINTIRFLAVDMVEKARSGHPGLPLGAAPMAYVLWDRFLRHNPSNPSWINRDRFILSAGHGSALLYSLLHLYGYPLSLNELKQFRQWGSKTPGHPEYSIAEGIEATTGPLGQGFAMGVGIALAEKFLENCFNTPAFSIINHFIYSIVSDGDLMEGVSAEAASLAGTLNLNKLIYLYDDNHISLAGPTDFVFEENVQHRFEAYGWNVLKVQDGNNLEAIEESIRKAQKQNEKPSLIIIRTHIGYGSPKQDTSVAHGQPLGPEAVLQTKKSLDWPTGKTFYISKETLKHFRLAINKGNKLEIEWKNLLDNYRQAEPELANQFDQVLTGEFPANWKSYLEFFSSKEDPIATRDASGKVMNVLSEKLHTLGRAPHHFLIGGSADLAPSTKTILLGYGDFGFSKACAHNIHYGVREHAMGAIANGMALHSHFIPYTATFLVFSDYMRPPIRLAALMKTHVIFVFTHDSIGLGEDGPTHQPIEQLMSLRAIPNLTVIRPADANETTAAWQVAIERKGPVVLVFTRQKLSILETKKYPIKKGVPRGAYILSETSSNKVDIILIATGSEVHLALTTQKKLKKMGINSRIVSMPSWELFEEQSLAYKKSVLHPDIPKLAIEAGVTLGWQKYVGLNGDVIGLNHFGSSAPGKIVYSNLGFNVDNVVNRVLKLLEKLQNAKGEKL